MEENYLDKRFDLIKKQDEDRSYEPSEKEIEEAYGYLDYCISCGKKIRFLESFSHGFEGNDHKFGCNIFSRIFGVMFFIIKNLLMLLIALPIYGIYSLTKFLVNKVSSVNTKEKRE